MYFCWPEIAVITSSSCHPSTPFPSAVSSPASSASSSCSSRRPHLRLSSTCRLHLLVGRGEEPHHTVRPGLFRPR